MSASMAARLLLTEAKLETLAQGIRALAAMDEPIGRVLKRMELADGLLLRQETAPLGVVLIVFESRPDVLPQLISLALRSGNGLLSGRSLYISEILCSGLTLGVVRGSGVIKKNVKKHRTNIKADTSVAHASLACSLALLHSVCAPLHQPE